MEKNALPAHLVGNWIWMTEGRRPGESRQLFRRDFVIEQLPATAELWVAASTSFQLYFNGRLTGMHPRACPKDGAVYVAHIPINFLLQPGTNQIGVQVFDAGKELRNRPGCAPGLWLQLDIDDEPFLWTNEDWMGVVAEGYVSSGIDQAVDDVQTEMVDFRLFPHGWQSVPFTPYRVTQVALPPVAPTSDEGAAMRWRFPKVCIPIELMRSALVPDGMTAELTERMDWEAPVDSGHFRESMQSIWVNFRQQTKSRKGGVFVAETYLYSKGDAWYNTECYCNRPYRLFLNESVVSQQAVPPPPVCAPPRSRGDQPLELADFSPIEVPMHLNAGWNRLFLVLDAASSGHGMTVLFTNSGEGELSVHTRPDDRAGAGWTVAGPLRTPFAQLLPYVDLPGVNRSEFLFDEEHAWDTAVLQRSWEYRCEPEVEIEVPPDSSSLPHQRLEVLTRERLFVLGKQQYVIFDFGRTVYGYPCLTARGSQGDILDVICGEHILDHRVLAFTGTRRGNSVLTLSNQEDRWMSDTPYGFRYIMVQVRRSTGNVMVCNVHGRVSQNRPLRDGGYFESSDPTLNRIWQTGVDTLGTTIQGEYLDSPCGERTQYIADSMVQSWAGFHVFGDYELSARGLENFASTQLETGELNSACPSGMLQILPDYSLLWIIWLHRHYTYTADQELLQRLLPAMERLLEYHEAIAEGPDGPQGDPRGMLGTLPFLDQDDEIERGGICTGLNGLYCRALHCAAELEDCAGATQLAQLFRERAVNVAAEMRELTWDEEAGLFADNLGEEGRSGRHSWQSNVLALYGGLADEADIDRIWDQLFCDEAPWLRFAPGESENPYFKFFVLETAFETGHAEWGIRMLKDYWGAMLEAGATTWWEMFSPAMPDDNRIYSHCHGYGASPNCFLVSELAGIRPEGAGSTRLVYAPLLLPELTSLKVRLPTPQGVVAVAWTRSDDGDYDISLSASYPVEVVPLIDEAYADQVTFNVSDSVTIIPPEMEDAPEAEEPEGDA